MKPETSSERLMKSPIRYLAYLAILLPSIALINHIRPPAFPNTSARTINCGKKVRLGDEYGGWVICAPATSLKRRLVYSIGIGRNIEWDKAMIQNFGTVHHGWDPTPTAESFFEKAPLPAGFTFHKFGLGASDGNVTLKLPEGNGDSYTVMEYHQQAKPGTVVNLPMLSIQSMMEMSGHADLAIVKMDIEGAEFDVIKKWSGSQFVVPADQVLVEFHERYFRGRGDLVNVAVQQMKTLGFDMVHHTKLEYTFAKRSAMSWF